MAARRQSCSSRGAESEVQEATPSYISVRRGSNVRKSAADARKRMRVGQVCCGVHHISHRPGRSSRSQEKWTWRRDRAAQHTPALGLDPALDRRHLHAFGEQVNLVRNHNHGIARPHNLPGRVARVSAACVAKHLGIGAASSEGHPSQGSPPHPRSAARVRAWRTCPSCGISEPWKSKRSTTTTTRHRLRLSSLRIERK